MSNTRVKLVPPYNPYTYTHTSTNRIRVETILRIIYWLLVVFGYVTFFVHYPLFWILLAPIVIFYACNALISLSIKLFYKKFDTQEHIRIKESFWRKIRKYPSVDIYIPVCGENIHVIEKTIFAATNIDYSDKKIYILDDFGDKEVKQLSKKCHITYLSRPDKGVMKKAGNLKFGFEHSNGDFYIVLDPDFVVDSNLIKELLPYMKNDNVGIVQSPQYFLTTEKMKYESPLEYGAGINIVDFFKIIQVAKDFLGGAMCVGTNAIYRRTAVDSIGGPYQDITEDIYTGYALNLRGYVIKYIPIILAYATSPNNLITYFNQQNRWCRGMLEMFYSGKFFTNKLTFSQKICFISSAMNYLINPIGYILSFQIFVLLIFYPNWINFYHILPFLPLLISTKIRTINTFAKFRIPSEGNFLSSIAASYTYTYTVITYFFQSAPTWIPTNIENVPVSKNFRHVLLMNMVYVYLYAFLVICVLAVFFIHLALKQYFNSFYYIFFFLALLWMFWNLYVHFGFRNYSKHSITK